MPEFTLDELARAVGGEVIGNAGRAVSCVAPLDTAGADAISIVASRRYLPYVADARAAAVLVSDDLACEMPETVTQIRVPDVHVALVEILGLLYPTVPRLPGVHPTALVEDDVELGTGVTIGPFVLLGRGARVGDRSSIGAHAVVGEGCRIGADTVVHSQVTLYPGVAIGDRCVVHSGTRLGCDGFGYAWVNGKHCRIPQVGGCRIENEVEIGANVTIDRGSIGDTIVGEGTKIDNLVHLGHNVRVGKHAILIAQVGVAGSSNVGDSAMLGGQAGISGHLNVGAGARVGAQAGVIGDVPAGETVSGYPARPHREAMRAQAALLRLPALIRRIHQLERTLLERSDSPAE